MVKYSNTLQKGAVRYIVFRERETWYAVGLEFNIVEEGDTPREALLLLFEAIQGYVEAARKMKARPAILNQKIDEEYEKIWRAAQEKKRTKYPVYTSGQLNTSKNSSDFAFV
ncbi:MAG: hypothetical protein A3E07_01125 [Candidatus Wildermuthbacteria bacterium RIFCSPHIGHO2_12_FULL_45_9]|uniref:HicB-like antitoxin of toxin-antitoxin system domain-containing protein n=1 Tax=Candidatus Wildermuthbacteria bacterium RIFCSPHIGHO2_02_FULL_45_25 TaxID=1802450 RepID=A0A1G2QZC3_9BACT|nr:MAG: hypothetical protein A2748_02070 [Candidatus Wildermuthbacteria bacterium RIFCSPHIGHO2_01_FULL_45_20]OHA65708.1 MAG: hypothetical protein A3C04_02215 [Candidatus Wildermuthbacteria bacterium RIFCSPHIGHO2_02_FULL_45_25]OHA70263.1 MAG: hypothetical protein A3E07_01125 [Candidatus Wildermuthbacteria bacterium RIFCSPHIGHO2_12_FULL_45_9]